MDFFGNCGGFRESSDEVTVAEYDDVHPEKPKRAKPRRPQPAPAPPSLLKATSDCPTPFGREGEFYSLLNAQGNPVQGYTVIEHQTDTSRAFPPSPFGPGTSVQRSPPGVNSGFDDWLNPGPFQAPGNSIQTFTVTPTTTPANPTAPQQPVMVQEVDGNMYDALGTWFQFPQVFVNGVPTPQECVYVP